MTVSSWENGLVRKDLTSEFWAKIYEYSKGVPISVTINDIQDFLLSIVLDDTSYIRFYHAGFEGGYLDIHINDLGWKTPRFMKMYNFFVFPFRLS